MFTGCTIWLLTQCQFECRAFGFQKPSAGIAGQLRPRTRKRRRSKRAAPWQRLIHSVLSRSVSCSGNYSGRQETQKSSLKAETPATYSNFQMRSCSQHNWAALPSGFVQQLWEQVGRSVSQFEKSAQHDQCEAPYWTKQGATSLNKYRKSLCTSLANFMTVNLLCKLRSIVL